VSDQVKKFLQLTDLGTTFMFGNLVNSEHYFTDGSTWPGFGFQFAFAVLPTIIFFSAFISILYHMGVMQFLVELMAKFMKWTLGTSGAETLSCSANVFVGQTEAPLLIRPFLDDMTPSELHAIMVGGFATIAGGVLAGYIAMGIDPGHLIAASVMSAPAALVMAKILMPETQESATAGEVHVSRQKLAVNLLDATSRGVTDGLKLAVNVGAMLIAFIALIGLVDVILGFGDKMIDGRLFGYVINETNGEFSGFFPGSLKTLFGTLLAPLAFCMGVPWAEAANVGNLLGIKIAANEFVAYGALSMEIAANALSPKAEMIATYALCGFANFASIGIQIGGIGALAPKRRSELAKVALRAMIGGALASWMTASIAGIFS
jgi:CNT family concentrative nucleoside transporter